MSVRVKIPSYFQRFTGGLDVAEVNGSTVGECLNNLVKQFPSLQQVLFYENGDFEDNMGVCINQELVTAWEEPLSRSVLDGDELYVILVGIGGG